MTDAPELLRRGPVPLDPANFTPLRRTPWGGTNIGNLVKAAVVPSARGQIIGEAWEFSCDPDFPSRLQSPAPGEPETLLELIQRYPEACLSPGLARRSPGGGGCEILVKLLDAATPLSLQVHPEDFDPALEPGECGKPESWLVLNAEPGAGIYLGFSRAYKKDELAKILRSGTAGADCLHFEPVKPGDYFEIGPGVPHAIGGGVTLLEPQRVLYGRSGKTFRMWDWGRRYDADGLPDPMGKPRQLHLSESLALVDPERQHGAAYAQTLRRDANRFDLAPDVKVYSYPANPYYRTYLVDMQEGGAMSLDIKDGYGALVMLTGRIVMNGVSLVGGQPAFLPHAAMPLTVACDADAKWALVVPARTNLSF
jgi:mannose-6-phosphate isomerase class I